LGPVRLSGSLSIQPQRLPHPRAHGWRRHSPLRRVLHRRRRALRSDRIRFRGRASAPVPELQKLRRFSIGLNYQSPIEVDLSGRRLFTQRTLLENPSAVAAFQQNFNDADASTIFDLPERIAFGFASRITVRTRVEADVVYEGWNRDEARIQTANSLGAAQEIVIPQRWSDTYSIRIGADFQQRRALLWRMGLGTARSTVPDDTFQPDFPDYDRFFYAFGFSYTVAKRYAIEGAWQLVQNRDRHISDTELVYDPSAPDYVVSNGQEGLYETQRIQIQLGLRVKLGKF
jgi:long-subunit fatty acid transport protein